MFLELAKSGKNVNLILPKNIFSMIKEKNRPELSEYLGLKNTAMYVISDDIKLTMAVTNRFLSISLYFKDGAYDFKRDLISFSGSALSWGEELFNHYQNKSGEIKQSNGF